jgi:hypothetical protein
MAGSPEFLVGKVGNRCSEGPTGGKATPGITFFWKDLAFGKIGAQGSSERASCSRCTPGMLEKGEKTLHGVRPWSRTEGAEPDAVQAVRPVLNGGEEETCGNVTRLVPIHLPRSHSSPRLKPDVRRDTPARRQSPREPESRPPPSPQWPGAASSPATPMAAGRMARGASPCCTPAPHGGPASARADGRRDGGALNGRGLSRSHGRHAAVTEHGPGHSPHTETLAHAQPVASAPDSGRPDHPPTGHGAGRLALLAV